jgi:hypothetical protein
MAQDWVALGDTLQSLAGRFRELGSAPPDEWRGLSVNELYASMRLLEARTRLECNAIMRALVHDPTGIGQPTPLQAHFCAMRVLCALDTLGVLHAELEGRPLYPRPPEKWSDAQLLEWLLVVNWGHRHDTWLKTASLALSMGVGMYSG